MAVGDQAKSRIRLRSGALVNREFPSGAPGFVKAKIVAGNRTIWMLRRSVVSTEFFIEVLDGVPATDLVNPSRR